MVDSCVKTSCGHMFCTDCFFKWIKYNKTCAICRETFIKPYKAKEIEEQETRLTELNDIDIQLREFFKISMAKLDKNDKDIIKQKIEKAELEISCKKITREKKRLNLEKFEINFEINALREMLSMEKETLKKTYNKEWVTLTKPKTSWWRKVLNK
tara:strand:+ start:1816 stop:2280 length:465 start_codon:yes stop_codon:yes gene_type:complete